MKDHELNPETNEQSVSDDGEKEVDFERPMSKEENQTNRLFRLLSTIEQGWKISIIRTHPSWCRGHLETIEVFEPDDTVDTDYLIRTWGGSRLHLKVHNERGQWIGGGSISLFSYQPKVRGKTINESDYFSQNPVAPPPAHPMTYGQQPQMDIGKLLELLQKGNKSELDLALKILERAPMQHQQIPQPQQQGIGSMAEQMVAMFSMMSQMKNFFGDLNGPAQNDSDSLGPVIGDVVKSLLNHNQTPQSRRALVSTRQKTGPNPTGSAVAPLRPVQELGDRLSDIANKLSSLSPSDAADVLMQALGDMPEDRRKEAMTAFLGNLTEDSTLDGLLNQDDTNSQDDQSDYDDDDGDNETSSSG